MIVFLIVTELNSFLIPLMSSAGDLRSDWCSIFASWQNSRPVHYLCYHCGIPGVFQHIYFSSWIGVPLNQKVQNNHYYLNIIPGIICGPSCMDYGKCPLSYMFKREQFVLRKVHSYALCNILNKRRCRILLHYKSATRGLKIGCAGGIWGVQKCGEPLSWTFDISSQLKLKHKKKTEK